MLVVTLKYVLLILRADNRGEGGIMALHRARDRAPRAAAPRRRSALLLLGMFGAALFYGDSVITPAISVLGAVEGLEVVAPGAEALRRADLGRRSWSGCSSCSATARGASARCSGRSSCSGSPCSPRRASGRSRRRRRSCRRSIRATRSQFLRERGWHVFAAVGAIVLALTGAEALYADMGHFGRRPIRSPGSAWCCPRSRSTTWARARC